jgi:hypothetical protein
LNLLHTKIPVNQLVVGSIPTAGANKINTLAYFAGCFFISQPDIEPDRCALNNVHYRYRILDLRVYIRHAPARLRVDAHMFDLALGYAAAYLLRSL